MFIGSNALTFDASKVTGFGKADGLPRIELDDSVMRLRVPMDELRTPGTHKFRLGELIDHSTLFAAYPELRKSKVTLVCNQTGDLNSSFFPHNGTIKCEYPQDFCERRLLGTLSHEIQHGVQLIEGFCGGTSHEGNVLPAYNRAAARLSRRYERTHDGRLLAKQGELLVAAELLIDRDASRARAGVAVAVMQLQSRSERIYMRTPGEIEARATDARLTFNDFDRQRQLPEHLQAEPVKHAVVARVYDRSMQHVRDMFNRERQKALHVTPVRNFLARVFHTALS